MPTNFPRVVSPFHVATLKGARGNFADIPMKILASLLVVLLLLALGGVWYFHAENDRLGRLLIEKVVQCQKEVESAELRATSKAKEECNRTFSSCKTETKG